MDQVLVQIRRKVAVLGQSIFDDNRVLPDKRPFLLFGHSEDHLAQVELETHFGAPDIVPLFVCKAQKACLGIGLALREE